MVEKEQPEWCIYLDVCCLNRPFDDQTQDRIRLESEAVIIVIEHCYRGEWRWITSDVVAYEIDKAPAYSHRERIRRIIEFAQPLDPLNSDDIIRGKKLQELGFSTYDALHIACAERGRADVFLTTDDRLIRLGKRLSHNLKVRVDNPLNWLQEVL